MEATLYGTCHAKTSLGICGQRRPRSDCASAQSDHGLCCPQTEPMDIIKVPDQTAHVQDDLNLHILRMLGGTFSLDANRIGN